MFPGDPGQTTGSNVKTDVSDELVGTRFAAKDS